jgi:hypothetical protein
MLKMVNNGRIYDIIRSNIVQYKDEQHDKFCLVSNWGMIRVFWYQIDTPRSKQQRRDVRGG